MVLPNQGTGKTIQAYLLAKQKHIILIETKNNLIIIYLSALSLMAVLLGISPFAIVRGPDKSLALSICLESG